MLSGEIGVRLQSQKEYNPFKEVSNYLQEADFVVANLEAPFHDRAVDGNPAFFFRSLPQHARLLKKNGIHAVSLANSHILDYGDEGLRQTQRALNDVGILYVGAGFSDLECLAPLIISMKQQTIGILSFMGGRPSSPRGHGHVANIHIHDAVEAVGRLANRVDHVIVSLHTGLMWQRLPTQDDLELCHLLIATGATMILGHHPHVLQGIEKVNSSLIAYSLGNFLVDRLQGHVAAKTAWLERGEGGILKISLDTQGVKSFEFIPTIITEDLTINFPASEQKAKILERVEELSRQIREGCVLTYDDPEVNTRLVPHELSVIKKMWQTREIYPLITLFLRIRRRHLKMLWGYLRINFYNFINELVNLING